MCIKEAGSSAARACIQACRMSSAPQRIRVRSGPRAGSRPRMSQGARCATAAARQASPATPSNPRASGQSPGSSNAARPATPHRTRNSRPGQGPASNSEGASCSPSRSNAAAATRPAQNPWLRRCNSRARASGAEARRCSHRYRPLAQSRQAPRPIARCRPRNAADQPGPSHWYWAKCNGCTAMKARSQKPRCAELRSPSRVPSASR